MREGAAQRGEEGRFGETRDREAERVRTESSEERDRDKGDLPVWYPGFPVRTDLGCTVRPALISAG